MLEVDIRVVPRFQHIFANPSHARPSTGLYSMHFRYNAYDPVKFPDDNDDNNIGSGGGGVGGCSVGV